MRRLVDFYCGVGGAAKGYELAGFDEIVGVDLAEQPNYPYTFIRGDVIEIGAELLREAAPAAAHASPPCQRFTALRTMANHRGDAHPELVAPTRAILEASGIPWVIENVPGSPLDAAVILDFPDREKLDLAREALGIPWAKKWRELSEAIPPAYTEYIGRALLEHLALAADAEKERRGSSSATLVVDIGGGIR